MMEPWAEAAAAECVKRIGLNAEKAEAHPQSITINLNLALGTCVAHATVRMHAAVNAPWAEDVAESRRRQREERFNRAR